MTPIATLWLVRDTAALRSRKATVRTIPPHPPSNVASAFRATNRLPHPRPGRLRCGVHGPGPQEAELRNLCEAQNKIRVSTLVQVSEVRSMKDANVDASTNTRNNHERTVENLHRGPEHWRGPNSVVDPLRRIARC